jgi:hypothetical protein
VFDVVGVVALVSRTDCPVSHTVSVLISVSETARMTDLVTRSLAPANVVRQLSWIDCNPCPLTETTYEVQASIRSAGWERAISLPDYVGCGCTRVHIVLEIGCLCIQIIHRVVRGTYQIRPRKGPSETERVFELVRNTSRDGVVLTELIGPG